MTWNRTNLDAQKRDLTVEALQEVLGDLLDLALQIKQAHWNVQGPRFRSVHLQLDEVVTAVRTHSDEVAERITTLGLPAKGNAKTVADTSRLDAYPDEFVEDSKTIGLVADRLHKTINGLRSAIATTSESDPVTEDLLIGVSGDLEKQLWMLQAHEGQQR